MKPVVTCVCGEDNIPKLLDILWRQNTSMLMRTVKQIQLIDLIGRLKLLEELKTNAQKVNEQKLLEEEEIEEILKEFSGYWNMLNIACIGTLKYNTRLISVAHYCYLCFCVYLSEWVVTAWVAAQNTLFSRVQAQRDAKEGILDSKVHIKTTNTQHTYMHHLSPLPEQV